VGNGGGVKKVESAYFSNGAQVVRAGIVHFI
jgi:hypothetical protein